MKTALVRCGVVLVVLIPLLTACASLPDEAAQVVLRRFEAHERARIHASRRATLLPEDQALGATEAWCITLTYQCWDCGHGQWHTCTTAYLVRLIDGEWQETPILLPEDWEKWEARGCLREAFVVGEVPR